MWRPVEGSFKQKSLRRLHDILSSYFDEKRIMIFKNDANQIQGIPDQMIIVEPFHAYLEYKRSAHENHRPNQDYYVELKNKCGCYAAFIYPENEQQIFKKILNYFLTKEKQQNECTAEKIDTSVERPS